MVYLLGMGVACVVSIVVYFCFVLFVAALANAVYGRAWNKALVETESGPVSNNQVLKRVYAKHKVLHHLADNIWLYALIAAAITFVAVLATMFVISL